MKKFLNLIILFIFVIFSALSVFAETEPARVMSLNYDNSSSILYINVANSGSDNSNPPLKYVRLSNPNRIYFDINNAVLVGEKQQILFEKSCLKEIKLAQFDTNPNIVRTVVTFEEDFDTTKLKLINLYGNIILKISPPELSNDYFNLIYDESQTPQKYSDNL